MDEEGCALTLGLPDNEGLFDGCTLGGGEGWCDGTLDTNGRSLGWLLGTDDIEGDSDGIDVGQPEVEGTSARAGERERSMAVLMALAWVIVSVGLARRK